MEMSLAPFLAHAPPQPTSSAITYPHGLVVFNRTASAGHLFALNMFEQRDVLVDGIHLVAIEGKRLFQLVEDADEVENETMGLPHLVALILIRSVHTRDRLQQGM